MEGYSLLAFSTETGQRRERHFHTDKLLAQLTGAESGLIVNNNAAATMLVLSTFSKDKEAVVSRGELVEIGGSFRMPDVMFQSGAIMHEVGTTNKTHLRDYEGAINENTGLLVKVHKSNYKVVGFSGEPPLEEMVDLGNRHDVPVYHDLGSGALIDFSRYGLFHEPTVQESVAAGAHVVTFSGDKLIGGPQSGMIVGKKEYIDRIKKNPLVRATRCGKLTYAAVEATLKLFLDEKYAIQHNTTVRRLTEPMEVLKKRAQSLMRKVKPLAPASATLVLEEQVTYVGGGSMPGEPVPTIVITVQDDHLAPEALALRLRQCSPPVFTRVQDASTVIDLRTLGQDEIPFVLDALCSIWEDIA
jgi:L-seryl-tRNA(Ser) seleniumtransferase